MKILTDTHTHTIATGHAYSTLLENIGYAKKRGLELIAVTDHAPAMPDACHIFNFMNIGTLPRVIEDIIVLRGVELNIIDHDGTLDIEEKYFSRLDWVIASAHEFCVRPGTIEDHNRMWEAVAKLNSVDVIGHCGDERYKFDYEKILPVFVAYNKLVEINAHSFSFRPGSKDNCKEIIKILKKLGGKIVVSSDAHFATQVGDFDSALEALAEADFPEELIVNRNAESVLKFLKDKKGLEI